MSNNKDLKYFTIFKQWIEGDVINEWVSNRRIKWNFAI